MLQEISFGKHYFEIATILRDSLFINGILWNMETWYDVKEKEIVDLEKNISNENEKPSFTNEELRKRQYLSGLSVDDL